MDKKENTLLSWLSIRKTYLLLLLILLVVLSGVLLFSSLRQQRKASQTLKPSPTPISMEDAKTNTSPSDLTRVTTRPLPQVFFETYENKAPLPSIPERVKTHTFKTDFSLEEILSLGQKLGLTQQKAPDDTYVILYNTTEMNNRGVLTFNRKTGEFSFQSWGVHKSQAIKMEGSEPMIIAYNFLSTLGVIDSTVTCPITYQRKSLEGVTFVECHRDWSLVGLPILNFVGALNIPEERRLAEVKLGETDENTPEDASIINTSTREDGKARPNDFNTVTIALSSDGRILLIESNLRQIIASTTYSSSDLLSPDEAFNQFITHQAQLSLTIPGGSGVVDWNKVYPDNQAVAKRATITDYLLTFLEKPTGVKQEVLVPMYLIRGVAELASGYRVRFTETVPALRSGLSFLAPLSGSVAGYSTSLAQAKSIKLGSFTPAPTTIITQGQQPPLPTPTPWLPPSTSCDPSKLEVAELPGIGKVGLLTTLGGPHTFFYIPSGNPALDKSIDEIRRSFFDLVSEQYTIFVSQEIKGDPALVSTFGGTSPTIQNMYDLFDEINKRYRGRQGKFVSEYAGGDLAPISPALFSKGTIPAVSQMQEGLILYVAEKTAKMLVEVIKNNDINSWAVKDNLFPKKTLANFSWIFYKSTAFDMPLPTNCPYITGASPSLYFYPQKPTQVRVKLGSSLVYADPSVKNNFWQVLAYPDGKIQLTTYNLQPTTRDRLYYEYDKSKVSFTEPKDGFVVKREEWEEFVRGKLAPQLGLIKRETDDLVIDVRNAFSDLKDKNSPYLKISLVDRKELDEKLPMDIKPTPDVFHRAHLLLTWLPAYKNIPEPQITRFQREGFTVIEVGVYLQ